MIVLRLILLGAVWSLAPACFATALRVDSGWGADAVLSRHISPQEFPDYIRLLDESGVGWVRERGTGQLALKNAFLRQRSAGLRVLVIAQDIQNSGGTDWGPFAEDLRSLWGDAKTAGAYYAEAVDGWELNNEPELAWWPDMPDRYAAHAKTLYLGLKAGARAADHDTPVLLGSLGLPPGPWLERISRNGLLYYADAWNGHYYGDSSQFNGFLDSNVEAMQDLIGKIADKIWKVEAGRRWPVKPEAGDRRPGRAESNRTSFLLPIWATEVGVNTVTTDTWSDPVRRKRQADWILSTAEQALAHPRVSVFMPFVLVHKGDGYALTESAKQTWPAWDEYSRFTRENPFPNRPTARLPSSVNPVVLQWLANPATASGHKLAAAYRWRASGKPIRGELRIYNFGEKSVSGRLRQTREAGDGTGMTSGGRWAVGGGRRARGQASAVDLTIQPGGVLSLPLSFALEDAPGGGEREWRQFTFEEESGRGSELGFALERSPNLYPPQAQPLSLKEWGRNVADFRFVPNAERSESGKWWQAINGVKVRYSQGALARFELGARPFDQEYPPMAAAYLPEGLPDHGWLRVATRELGPAGVRVRVDVVDRDGRRFTQWENLGQVRGLPAAAPRWLNVLDFHPYAWGKLDKQRRLEPNEVRQVQLRFYASKGPTMIDVELGFGANYGNELDSAGEVPRVGAEAKIAAPVE